jgi:hypothetical protein
MAILCRQGTRSRRKRRILGSNLLGLVHCPLGDARSTRQVFRFSLRCPLFFDIPD